MSTTRTEGHGSLICTTLVVRSGEMIEAEVAGEIVALDIDRGFYYGLNKVGSRVWRLIGSPIPITDICAKLRKEYEVDAAICEQQVLDLLEGLRTEGLVKALDPNVVSTSG
jgi:hypothetical protein